jgi:tRNA(Ile2) C34 agmatinyltransferase TiaS
MPAVAVAPTDVDRGYGERALDDVIVRVWEELAARRAVVCPVCGGEMEPEYGAQGRPIAGRCRSCRTTLS